MFGRKHDFKPDKTGRGLLAQLYITRRQRLVILKWSLLGALLLLLSLVQDVMMSQVSLGGATTDLVSAGIFLICMLLTPEQGGIFALIGSIAYYFSGSAPGSFTIAMLTCISLLVNIFRHSFLRRSFGSLVLSAAVAMVAYSLLIFGLGLFLGLTTLSRLGIFFLTGILSAAVMPLMYPVFLSVCNIGGETWKE